VVAVVATISLKELALLAVRVAVVRSRLVPQVRQAKEITAVLVHQPVLRTVRVAVAVQAPLV
jgi:hypothetical protein